MTTPDFDLAILGRGPAALGFAVGVGGSNVGRVAIVGPRASPDISSPDLGDFPRSPKLRRPDIAREVDAWRGSLMTSGDVALIGIHGVGGGARHWGATCMTFDVADLERNGMDAALFAEGYRYWAQRMPISGNRMDSLAGIYAALPPSGSTPRAAHATSLEGVFADGRVRVGCARVAVETAGTLACTGCNKCLSGCAFDSIWAPSETDFQNALPAAKTIDAEVIGISREADGFLLTLRAGDAPAGHVRARKLVLACGAPSTFRLTQNLAAATSTATLLYHPSFAFVLLAGPTRKAPMFGMAQAAFHLRDREDKELATGAVFAGRSVSGYEQRVFADNILVDRAAQVAAPYFWFGNGYLGSDVGAAHLEMRDGVRAVVDRSAECERTARYGAVRKLLSAWSWRVRAPMLVFMKGRPGVDVHYAGGVPQALQEGFDPKSGALPAIPGLHIVGGAAFRHLPPRSPTLSFIVQAWAAGRRFAA
ncbi:MAG: hypothetical protein JNM47_16590 [Hyphomonadaceae bacterium]|nr:hypothetical protein [Hyphomonadaceae bacterium]